MGEFGCPNKLYGHPLLTYYFICLPQHCIVHQIVSHNYADYAKNCFYIASVNNGRILMSIPVLVGYCWNVGNQHPLESYTAFTLALPHGKVKKKHCNSNSVLDWYGLAHASVVPFDHWG